MGKSKGSASSPEPSESFCVLPFTHLFVDEGGQLGPCCMVETRQGNVDETGAPYHISELVSLDSAWDSTFMRNLRQDMRVGRRPPTCARCFQHEDLGIRSYRQVVNERFHHLVAAGSGRDDDVPTSLRSADIRLGNLCNLRCRMCGPAASRGLAQETAEIQGWEPDHPYLVAARDRDWYERPEFWDFLERYAGDLEFLHFGGGEPLLVTQKFDFLQRLAASGLAAGMRLSYITNLTVLPPRIWELWPRFESVVLTVSVDAYGELNSFIRHPSRWQSLAANLETLERDFDRLNLANVSLNTTVQAYNVLALTELFDYTLAHCRRICPYPNLSLLNHPTCLSAQILPPQLKEEAARRLRSFAARKLWPAAWRGPELDQFRGAIEGVVQHMMAADHQDEIAEFRRWNEVFDRHRRQSLVTVLPELAPLYG